MVLVCSRRVHVARLAAPTLAVVFAAVPHPSDQLALAPSGVGAASCGCLRVELRLSRGPSEPAVCRVLCWQPACRSGLRASANVCCC